MKRCIVFVLLCSVVLGGCGHISGGGDVMDGDGMENSYRQVSQDEAMRMMAQEEDYIILDVRTFEEYAQGHIEDAICVPNESIGEQAPAELPDKDQLIFVYCRSGNRSKQASEKLFNLGYRNIVEFGGINTWTAAIVEGPGEEPSQAARPVLMLDGAEETESGGISLIVTGYADSVITARLSNHSGELWYYGAAFSIREKSADGAWKTLEWPEDVAWIQIAYELKDGEEKEIQCDVSALELDSGEYSLVKGELEAPFRLVRSE